MSYVSAVTADNPRAWWRAKALLATDIETDASGYGHGGTYVQTVTMQQTSPITGDIGDTAVLYGGGHMSATHATDIMFSPAFTMECWIRSAAPGNGNRYVLSKSRANVPADGGYGIFKPNGGNLKAFYSTGSAFKVGSDSSFNPWDGNWHHVVATFDGTTLALTIDKVVRATDSLPGTVGSNTDAFVIADIPGGGFPTTATLDEVALYDYALTGARIGVHYDAAPTLPTVATAISAALFNNSSFDLRQDGRWFDEKSEVVQWYPGRKCSCTSEMDANRANPLCLVCSGTGTFYANPSYITAALSAASNTKILMDFGVALPGDIIMSLRPMDDVLIADRDQVKFTWETGESYEGELAKRGAASSDKLIYDALSLDAVTQSDPDWGTVTSFLEITDYTHASQSDTLTWLSGRGPAQGSTYSVRYRPRFSYLCFTPPAERRERGTSLGQRVLLRRKHIALAKTQP